MIEYIPEKLYTDFKQLLVGTAWRGLDQVVPDILKRFNIKTDKAIEFGVETGYSTSILAQIFKEVIGVDTFMGDVHAGTHSSSFRLPTERNLRNYSNVKLVESDYQNYIRNNDEKADLIHIDIVHHYKETYECGDWAVKHTDIVIFHDTLSFADVRNAVAKLAEENNREFYNYPNHCGLGILVKRQ